MPYYIEPHLYFNILRSMEESFMHDFNMIIDNFSFY